MRVPQLLCALAVAVATMGRGSEAGLALTDCVQGVCVVDATLGDSTSELGFLVSGAVAVDEAAPCSSANGGSVSVTLYVAGETLTSTGSLWQGDGCGADGVSPVWTLSAAFDGVFIVLPAPADNVALRAAALTLTGSGADASFAGTLSGEVEVDGAAGTLAASVSVSSSAAVTAVSLSVSGAFSVGPLSASALAFSMDMATGVFSGSGTLGVDLAAYAGPTLAGDVVTVERLLYYSQTGAWDVAVRMAEGSSVDVLGLSVSDVSVALALAHGGGGADWAGTVGGTVSSLFGGAGGEGAVAVTADFSAETGLTALRGDVTLVGNGVSFSGTLVTDGTTSTGDGALLVGGSVAAQASFTYTHATKAFAVLGSVQGALQVGTVTLSSAGVTLSKADGGAWSGSVSGTAALFGGTAAASMAFADGTLASLAVSTTFVTGNGLLSGSLAFDYVRADTCATSTGTFGGVLKMSGAAELAFDGTVAFDGCTGVVSVAASVDGDWAAPGGVSVAGVAVQATSSGFADGSTSTALSAQTWVGSVSGTTSGADVAVAFDVAFDTSSDASSVEAMLSYADTNLIVQVMVNSDCSGSGLVQVQNLPSGVPALEVAVAYTRESCGGASKAWALEGSLGDSLLIDFSGKTLSLAPAVVRVVSDEAGALSVEVVAGLAPFEVVAAFGAGDAGAAFTLTARTAADAAAGEVTPGAFLAAMSGGVASVFGSGVGSAFSSLFSGMTELTLTDLLVVFDFVAPSISLTATGTLFGAGFDVLVVVEKAGSAWQYALALTTTGLSDLSFPGLAGTVVDVIAPSSLTVSVANAATSFAGKTLPQGLSLAATLPLDGSVMAGITAVAPSSLNDQTAAASGADGGVTIVASLTSSTEMRLALALAGGVELGSPDVFLREVSLLLVVKAAGSPEFGFQVVIDVTMDERVLSASAALLVDATGLSLAVALDSSEPWNEPFGMKGVAILFPLGLSLAITPAGILSEFALTGGVQLSAATGYVTLSVSLAEPTKNAFQAEVTTLDLQDVLVGLLDCTACTQGVAGVLTDMSVDHFLGSFNADPVNAVTITFADVAVEIPAGVSIELTNLDLWGVLKVAHASFALNADGMSAAFEAEPVAWGPLTITAASSSASGPQFAMVLTETEQSLLIDGKAVLFGQSVSLYLQMSDNTVEGHFALSLASLQADVTMTSSGRPGDAGFSNSVRAELEADLIGDIVGAATEYLLGLASEMDAELAAADAAVLSADSAWEKAKEELKKVEEDATAEIKEAEDAVESAEDEVSKFDCGNIWLVSDGCKAAKAVVKEILSAAKKTLEGVRKATKALVALAEVVVEESKILLDFAGEVLTWAQAAVDVFAAVVSAIAGALEDMLIVHSLVFTSDVSNSDVAVSFAADVTIFGTRHRNLAFSVRINFDAIVDHLSGLLSDAFTGDFGGAVVDEKPGAPSAVAGAPQTVADYVDVLRDAAYYVHMLNTVTVSQNARDCAASLAGCADIPWRYLSYYPVETMEAMCTAAMEEKCADSSEALARQLWLQEALVSSSQRALQTALSSRAADAVAMGTAAGQVQAYCDASDLLSVLYICPTDVVYNLQKVLQSILASDTSALLTAVLETEYNVTTNAESAASAEAEYQAAKADCDNELSVESIGACAEETFLLAASLLASFESDASVAQRDALEVSLFNAIADAQGGTEADVLVLDAVSTAITERTTSLSTTAASLQDSYNALQCASQSSSDYCKDLATQLAHAEDMQDVLHSVFLKILAGNY